VGAQLYQPSLEECGVSANLDRLAALLSEHTLDRRALFWSEIMAKQADIDPNTISGQLRQAIIDSGLSFYAVARAAGLSPGMVTRFMAGDRAPSLETVDKLAAALGLRLCKVTEGGGTNATR
jgi:DNA-binding phage protein